MLNSFIFADRRLLCQGDSISAYLFIIALEIIFAMIKSNPKIIGLNILNQNYLYTAYADDTTFFLNNQKSIDNITDIKNLLFAQSILGTFEGEGGKHSKNTNSRSV